MNVLFSIKLLTEPAMKENIFDVEAETLKNSVKSMYIIKSIASDIRPKNE